VPVYGRWGSVDGQLDYKFRAAPAKCTRGSVFGFMARGGSFGNGSDRLCLVCGKSLRKNSKGRTHDACGKKLEERDEGDED